MYCLYMMRRRLCPIYDFSASAIQAAAHKSTPGAISALQSYMIYRKNR